MNLATNSAHAIGEGVGLIEVGLDALTVSTDLARTSPDLHEGRYARLSVSDNGCGMDKATLERIFDPFFTTKPAGQGTGLGLSTVHGIMRGHEGAVTVYSQPGKGSTFRLYFPAVGDDAAEVETPPREVARGRGERVLYVDDEDTLVRLATRILRRLGYEITGHTDPAEALQAFRSRPHDFDVVVTDLSMPGMSGFDLARGLLEIRPETPVVMTSGYLRPEDQETASRIGIRALILKPNTVEELGLVLDKLLRDRPNPDGATTVNR
jgi:CheY-like chemotaxis protein